MQLNTIVQADALEFCRSLPDQGVHCVVTSPPYYALRDYGVEGQIGAEETPHAYLARLWALFDEIWRALRDDGTVWVNLGDSYNGSGKSNGGKNSYGAEYPMPTKISDLPNKSLMMIPARFAIGMQERRWILRSEIVWHKPAPMPESVTDRPTKAHEMIYLFTKSPRYFYDADAIREPHKRLWDKKNGGNLSSSGLHKANGTMRVRGGDYPLPNPDGRNMRDVWTIGNEPLSENHYAAYPSEIPTRCIKAGSPKEGIVFDPFMGSGTTALAARNLERNFIGCDLSAEYVAMANRRLNETDPFQHTQLNNGMVQKSMFADDEILSTGEK